MGELLEIESWVGTPMGGTCAVCLCGSLFFYGRWVLTDKPVSKGQSGCRSVRYPLGACKRSWLSCVDGMHECLVF
jgi:hypothetical protein